MIDTSKATVGTGNHTWDVMYESLRFGHDSVEEHLRWYCSHGRTSRLLLACRLDGTSNRVVWLALGRDTQETKEEEPGVVLRIDTSPRRF